MKRYMACAVLALVCMCSMACAEYEISCGYRIIQGEDGKFGLEDGAGAQVLPAVYDEIGGFTLWDDGAERCLLLKDDQYGWFPAASGGAAPCSFEGKPVSYSDYVICGERIWDLDGKPVNDTLYAQITVLSDGDLKRLAAWEFTEDEEKWLELADSWGGRMDFQADAAGIYDENLREIGRLECDFMDAYSEGLSGFIEFDESEDDWMAGYVDEAGREVVRRRTNSDLGSFRGGYAHTFRNGSGGANLLGRDFELALEKDYSRISEFIGGYAVLMDEIWSRDGKMRTGYQCTLVNSELEELMRFKSGTDSGGIWCNGKIIINDGDHGLYYVHDLGKRLLLKGKYVGAYTPDGRVRYQSEAGLWGYISDAGENVVPAAYADARDFSEGFAAVQEEGGKWLFLDIHGRNAFGQSWDYAEGFREGYAYVRNETGGYMIDARGRKVRPAMQRLDTVSDSYKPYVPAGEWQGSVKRIFAEKHGMRIFEDMEGKYGIMDAAGNVVLGAVYDMIKPPQKYADGIYRAVLKRNERYGWYGADGFCDARWHKEVGPEDMFAGRMIVNPEPGDDWFDDIGDLYFTDTSGNRIDNIAYGVLEPIGGGMLAMRESGSSICFVVDGEFREVFSLECDGFGSESEGIFSFKRDGLWGYCDSRGNVIVPPRYSMASPFHDGYAVVGSPNQRAGEDEDGLIDREGNVVIEIGKYDMIYGFKDGRCIIRVKDRSYKPTGSNVYRPWHDYVIIDTLLRPRISFTGNCHGSYEAGLFQYYDGSESVLMDESGREIRRAEDIGTPVNGFYRYADEVNGETVYGYLDLEGKIAIPAQYADAVSFSENGLCPVCVDESEGWKYINAAGETVLSGSWDYAEPFYGEYAGVHGDGGEWYIDERGEIIAPRIMDGGWF